MYDEKEDFAFHLKEVARMAREMRRRGAEFAGKTLLDVGAGEGMHAYFLQALGCRHIYATDLTDYDALYDGAFRRLLEEKHRRHGFPIDLDRISFVTGSATRMAFEDGFFDVAVSFNAFEHIATPDQALDEIIRRLKPKGYAYLTFDPLFYCDTGGHMNDFVGIPWGHLVYSESEYVEMLRKSGASERSVEDFLHGLNRLRVRDFRRIFHAAHKKGAIRILLRRECRGFADEANREHPNYRRLRKTMSREDLLTRGMEVVFRKR